MYTNVEVPEFISRKLKFPGAGCTLGTMTLLQTEGELAVLMEGARAGKKVPIRVKGDREWCAGTMNIVRKC